MKKDELKKYLAWILGMIGISATVLFGICYLKENNIIQITQAEVTIYIWIISILNVGAILSFVVMLITDKTALPLVSEEYQKKNPVLVCRCNSYFSCIIFMFSVMVFLFLFGGGIAGFILEGMGPHCIALAFCSLMMLGLCIFIWFYMVNCVLMFYEGGLVYRDLPGKVHCIKDEEVEYVYILEYGEHRSIRIHTTRMLISLPNVATNYYEAKEYARKHYPDREAYDRRKGDEMPSSGKVKAEEMQISLKDAENCLLQQTTSYRRDYPILFASNDKNELLLVYYVSNTFYIAKAACEKGKLNISYDFRRKHPTLESFQYRNWRDRVTATLKLRGIEIDFTLQPKFQYHGMGCVVLIDQTSCYQQFLEYIDVCREHINEAGAMRKKETGYLDILKNVQKLSEEDKKEIWNLLDKEDSLEAIRRIQTGTGLGLADCKKIADNPYMYL